MSRAWDISKLDKRCFRLTICEFSGNQSLALQRRSLNFATRFVSRPWHFLCHIRCTRLRWLYERILIQVACCTTSHLFNFISQGLQRELPHGINQPKSTDHYSLQKSLNAKAISRSYLSLLGAENWSTWRLNQALQGLIGYLSETESYLHPGKQDMREHCTACLRQP